MRCRWLSTVRAERCSRAAIFLLDNRCAASVAISRSRPVSGVGAVVVVWSPGVRAPSRRVREAARPRRDRGGGPRCRPAGTRPSRCRRFRGQELAPSAVKRSTASSSAPGARPVARGHGTHTQGPARLRTATRARRDAPARTPRRRSARLRGAATPLGRTGRCLASPRRPRARSRAPWRSPLAASAHPRPMACSPARYVNGARVELGDRLLRRPGHRAARDTPRASTERRDVAGGAARG